MKKSKGYRARTRHLFKRNPRERGKGKISRLLHEYEAGDYVIIKTDPSVHKGMPHRRYHGKVGTVIDKRGRAYIVGVTQGDTVKEVIIRPEHLEPYRGG